MDNVGRIFGIINMHVRALRQNVAKSEAYSRAVGRRLQVVWTPEGAHRGSGVSPENFLELGLKSV